MENTSEEIPSKTEEIQSLSIKEVKSVSNCNLPIELWHIILTRLNLRDLLKARLICKRMGKIVSQYLRDTTSGYPDLFSFYNYETYYLFDILMENEMDWTRIQTNIGKFAIKLLTMRGAYNAAVLGHKKCYARFVRTRCLTFEKYKSLFPNESDWVILELWGKYKHESWTKLSRIEKSIIKMECKFDYYLKYQYSKAYGTWLPITMTKEKIKEISKMMKYEDKRYGK